MAETKIPKIPDALVVGSAMAMYANATEGQINPSVTPDLNALPIGHIDTLTPEDLERITAQEKIAQERAITLARAALEGVTPTVLEMAPRRSLKTRFRRPDDSYQRFLSAEDFEPGGAIDIIRDGGRIAIGNKAA